MTHWLTRHFFAIKNFWLDNGIGSFSRHFTFSGFGQPQHPTAFMELQSSSDMASYDLYPLSKDKKSSESKLFHSIKSINQMQIINRTSPCSPVDARIINVHASVLSLSQLRVVLAFITRMCFDALLLVHINKTEFKMLSLAVLFSCVAFVFN